MVIIVALIVGAFFSFMFMNLISAVQTAYEPILPASQFISGDAYMAYYYAATFITGLWKYILAIVIIILAYWVYIYTQRKGAGYL